MRESEVEGDAVPSTSDESEQPKENGVDHEEEEKQPGQLTLEELMEWLKDKPPLSPDELSKLHIERNDFMVALKKVQPSAKREGFATVPDVTWNDIGSLKDIREELKMTVLVKIFTLFTHKILTCIFSGTCTILRGILQLRAVDAGRSFALRPARLRQNSACKSRRQ